MTTSAGEQVIAIEEHYWDPELTAYVAESDRGGAGVMQQRTCPAAASPHGWARVMG